MKNRFILTALLLALPVVEAFAQQDTIVTEITVQESMGPVEGAVVTSGALRGVTNANGTVRLALSPGSHVVNVTRIGYAPKRVVIASLATGLTRVTIEVEMTEPMVMEMEEITVTATRTERLAGQTPERVEVLDEMEVDENTLMAPSGITMLLNETPGLRVQNASPTLGTGSVRILGLPGQYTALLADGLPIYGGAASALGPLDISPVDLARVELIKGAASALYGGQALGGVINLVSKQPTGRSELLVNRRTRGVTDGATWLSRRFSENSGLSLLVSGTIQDKEDIDRDGWTDQSDARRWGIRPRFFTRNDRGRVFFATLGYGYDDRQGGTLPGFVAPNGSSFSEGLTSRRADMGAILRLPQSDSGNLSARFAVSNNSRIRKFGSGPLEKDRTSTGFLEVTRMRRIPHGSFVVGGDAQVDAYANKLNDAFDHSWVTPGVFLTAERAIGLFTTSASVRVDVHPEEGTQLTERLALLFKPMPLWSFRLSGGTGFAPPTSMTEEIEAIGLRSVRASNVRGERSAGAMLDISGRVRETELLLTGYGSVISHTIQLAGLNDGSLNGKLRNSAGPTRMAGLEAAAVWHFGGGKLLMTYGYAKGSETNAETEERQSMPLINRHRAGADLMLERPGVYRIGIEGIYYGRQSVHDNPYREFSKPYVYVMALAMRQFGPVEVVANFENLLDVRQTKYQSLVMPTPGVGGRWTTDVWAPLEGFMANVALRYRWN